MKQRYYYIKMEEEFTKTKSLKIKWETLKVVIDDKRPEDENSQWTVF